MKKKLGSNVPMQPTIPKMPSNTSNALEALDSVNATQSNALDSISRQAAIKALDKRFDSIPMEQTTAILLLRRDLRELPPVNTSETPNSSDTISRAKAIEALKNDMASLDHIIKGMSANDVRLDAYVSQRNQVNYDIYTINNLPPAQPERIKGRWIPAGGALYQCDQCGVVSLKRKFCSECGADMRER